MAEHTGFQKLVAEAKKHITEISPQDAASKLNSGDAVIVDVRDKDEWDEAHIPGARHMSRGTIELDIEEKVPDAHTMIICHCGGAADRHSPPRRCKKWVTKTSIPWPADSEHGKQPVSR